MWKIQVCKFKKFFCSCYCEFAKCIKAMNKEIKQNSINLNESQGRKA